MPRTARLFCKIGNPAGFRHTLDACGCNVLGLREFPDHHRFAPADLDGLSVRADGLDASLLLCTAKDLVNIPADRLGNRPLWAVGIEIEFRAGREPLESRLQKLLRIGYPTAL
jgi:tetraacyldisaccharide 4'-kinase